MDHQKRKADHPINPLILNRWSPRAMTGEKLEEIEILSLFEAARWAPSSYNKQPWRFLYAKRETPHFKKFFDLLVEFNQGWCHRAALLGVILSEQISTTAMLDTGAAWENLALEGATRGLVVHGMEGFDYEKARQALKIPENVDVLAMFAVGKKAGLEVLSPELQKRELPSTRKPIAEFAFEGQFPK
jgi:nitroreductase